VARIHEYQGKALLKENGISIPEGKPAYSPEEAKNIFEEMSGPAVIKAQAWTTSRFAKGLIQFANTPEEAFTKAKELLGKTVNNFSVEVLLVEKKINIQQEFYGGIIINDSRKTPEIIFSSIGGSGIEEIAQKHPDRVARTTIDIIEGFKDYHARNLIARTGIHGSTQNKIAGILIKLWNIARKYEARSAEINPIVLTDEGTFLAADCRIAVDDYAVFRHPGLGIEIAREFGHPPTELDKIAYDVEKHDFRGTFYFIQLEKGFQKGDGYLAFHGAGGGGSMMSMDAVQKKGFKIANFTDTSGNPPASKVYRAAKIMLAQDNIDGYFGSGSGVASQEQVNSARGLVKAFREEKLRVPAVIRLGGNMEDEAVELLTKYTADLELPVEGYKKDDPADYCADRIENLINEHKDKLFDYGKKEYTTKYLVTDTKKPYNFNSLTGRVLFDHNICSACENQVCVSACVPQILKLENDLPVLAITEEEAAKGKCTECLACELECYFHGNQGCYVDLPIAGLDEYENRFLPQRH
jgi:succinyl-CoA synthetase beta subunit